MAVLDIISWGLILVGGAFGIIGGIGLLRFPDFFTRLHAAGITDTMCAPLIIGGLMLQSGFTLTTMKLVFIIVFLFLTSPTASHALAKAAVHGGEKPILKSGGVSPVGPGGGGARGAAGGIPAGGIAPEGAPTGEAGTDAASAASQGGGTRGGPEGGPAEAGGRRDASDGIAPEGAPTKAGAGGSGDGDGTPPGGGARP